MKHVTIHHVIQAGGVTLCPETRCLLGDRDTTRPVPVRPHQYALLARLMRLRPGQVLEKGACIEAIWPDNEPERSDIALRFHVHGARRALLIASCGRVTIASMVDVGYFVKVGE